MDVERGKESLRVCLSSLWDPRQRSSEVQTGLSEKNGKDLRPIRQQRSPAQLGLCSGYNEEGLRVASVGAELEILQADLAGSQGHRKIASREVNTGGLFDGGSCPAEDRSSHRREPEARDQSEGQQYDEDHRPQEELGAAAKPLHEAVR